jgi:preprotein translocase SecE subunit
MNVAEETKKKRRIVKKPETVRQQAAKAATAQPKPRRVRRTVRVAATPVKALLRIIGKLLRPFRFLLAPFKTRPARFVGRILAKVFAINYFKNSWKELKLVTWPNAKETTKLTLAVFAFAITFSLFIAVVDYGLDKVFQKLLLN